MKLIRTEDAVGHVLCHDMTQIIPGVTRCEIPEGTYCHRRRYSGASFHRERTSVCLGEDRRHAS